MAPSIPDGWIPFNACGAVIEGTRFICFKVPLKKSVQIREIKPGGIKELWDVPSVLEKIPKLGAVVDLTNTARYYSPEEFLEAGVLHRKILIEGRKLPPEHKIREFEDAVDGFLSKDRDSLIGVHCTHGLNRTGYMVCRYMRDKLGIPAEEAISRFEKARGHKIEREIYLTAIRANKSPPDSSKRIANIDNRRLGEGSQSANTRNASHTSKSTSHRYNFKYDY